MKKIMKKWTDKKGNLEEEANKICCNLNKNNTAEGLEYVIDEY